MDKQALIKQVKALLGKAETEKALVDLMSFLNANPQYANLSRLAIQAQAQYKKTKADEAKGTISFDNAKLSNNQVNDQILNILDALETGQIPTVSNTNQASIIKYWPILGILLLGAIGLIAYQFLGANTSEKPLANEACPSYIEESKFNILILPFRKFAGGDATPHEALKLDLGSFIADTDLDNELDVGIYKKNAEEIEYPANAKKAEPFARECKKVGLIIWGTYEDLEPRDVIQTNFKFLDVGDEFKIKELKVTEDSGIDTVSSISSIATEGVLSFEIKDNLKTLLGVIAHNMGNDELAIELLENSSPSDSLQLLGGMILADSYINQGNNAKAEESYKKVLENHPNYWLALRNEAALYYDKGDYLGTIKELSVRLEDNPEDTVALALRARAYLEAGILDKAKIDLDKAAEKMPNDPYIKKRRKEWVEKRNAQRRKVRQAEQEVHAEPKNVDKLEEVSTLQLHLAQYNKAESSSRRILAIDNKNLSAYTNLIASKISQGKITEARRLFEEAKSIGIDSSDLLKNVPELKAKLFKRK